MKRDYPTALPARVNGRLEAPPRDRRSTSEQAPASRTSAVPCTTTITVFQKPTDLASTQADPIRNPKRNAEATERQQGTPAERGQAARLMPRHSSTRSAPPLSRASGRTAV